MTLDEFISQWSGKGIDFDGYYGFQCMDLAHKYCVDCVGKDFPATAGASDEWNLNWDGYDKIANSPTNVPSKGDVIIWSTGVGPNGHIAVFISGDANSFTSFDQNWPLGSLCHLQTHNYTNVLGWFHPQQTPPETVSVDKPTFEQLVTKSTEDDAFHSAGYSSPNYVDTVIKALQSDKSSLEASVSDLQGQVKDLQLKLSACLSSQPPQGTTTCHDSDIRPLVNSGWITYLRSRGAIQKLLS